MSSAKSEDTKTRILEAACEILESDDPRKSRMSDIAKAAGISRQALYLHYPSRTELLVATARHCDIVLEVDKRLAESRASDGAERLDAFIDAWGNYIPEIYGVARAFLAMMESDEAAAAAWKDRMDAVRHGCEAAITALETDGVLDPNWSHETATDWLWTQLSVRNWGHLVRDCGWSQDDYIKAMQRIANNSLVASAQ